MKIQAESTEWIWIDIFSVSNPLKKKKTLFYHPYNKYNTQTVSQCDAQKLMWETEDKQRGEEIWSLQSQEL